MINMHAHSILEVCDHVCGNGAKIWLLPDVAHFNLMFSIYSELESTSTTFMSIYTSVLVSQCNNTDTGSRCIQHNTVWIRQNTTDPHKHVGSEKMTRNIMNVSTWAVSGINTHTGLYFNPTSKTGTMRADEVSSWLRRGGVMKGTFILKERTTLTNTQVHIHKCSALCMHCPPPPHPIVQPSPQPPTTHILSSHKTHCIWTICALFCALGQMLCVCLPYNTWTLGLHNKRQLGPLQLSPSRFLSLSLQLWPGGNPDTAMTCWRPFWGHVLTWSLVSPSSWLVFHWQCEFWFNFGSQSVWSDYEVPKKKMSTQLFFCF